MSGVTLRDTSHTWNVRNVVGVTLLSHVVGVTLLSHIPPQPPHSISSTRTTPWIIQGVVREKYSGSSRVLLSKRMARTSLSQSSLGTQEIPAGLPTPTIDKVSFCFEIVVQPTCFLRKLLLTTFVSRPAYLSSLKTLPITLPSTTTPWIIPGVVPEKYFGSSKVLSPPREWPGPAYRKAPWALRRYRRGYPTPTIDKVSLCFVNPTYLL